MDKRIIALLLCVVMLFCFTSCKANNNNDGQSEINSNAANTRPNDRNPTHDSAPSATKIVSTLFKSFPSARQIYVVDLIEVDSDTVALLRLIQGLAAKIQSAAIYYITDEADRFWMDYMRNELGVYFSEITIEQLLALYGDTVETVVLYTPDTFEYALAWNNAQLRDNAVCATYAAAEKCGLIETAEIIDPRGVYSDWQSAYDFMLSLVEGKNYPLIIDCDEYSEFADYAFASGAFMLPVAEDGSNLAYVAEKLMNLSVDMPGVVFTDSAVSDSVLGVYSSAGYGNISVGEFGNSTVFSSVSTDYEFDSPKVQKGNGKKGNIYLSLIIDSSKLGDVVNSGYSVCLAKRRDYNISFELPCVMYKLAPSVVLWYSINTRQSGDSVVPDGGWCNIDHSAIDEDMYKMWHSVNNHLLDKCGMTVAVTDKLSDEEGELFSELSKASGVFEYGNVDGIGVADEIGNIPSFDVSIMDNLKHFEQSIETLAVDADRPLYYAYSIPMQEYLAKLPIYDDYQGLYLPNREPDGYYSITEIIAVLQGRLSDSVKFISPAQLSAYAKND